MKKPHAKTYYVRGGKPLRGEVRVSGAKNAATKELVAALLADAPVTLHNVPEIGDVRVTLEMLAELGAKVSFENGTAVIDARRLKTEKVAEAFSRKNRIPILLLGPLLHRFGKAMIPALGGCTIGARPIDFHLDALRKMGASIMCEKGFYVATAKKLKGAIIDLPFPSVGATENVMLAAVKAKGTTIIRNAAVEPEIMDLAVLLQAMGAIINLDVNRTWVIEGVDSLHGAEHCVIPDRIVAASFMVAAALTGGDVFVRDARQTDLLSFLNALRRVGVPFEAREDGIRVTAPKELQPVVIETDVHPGFMTDWQQPFVMLLTQAKGVSIVHETVYEDRFGYTDALVKMGAKIQLHSECLGGKPCRYINHDYRHSAVIVGPTPLKAAEIAIPDLRAGFSYLIAALIAKGKSKITGVEQIERGYEDVIGKLKSLGAEIEVK
ncbi:UDP-N-acetylglucosamine 1-carboxyvinyltransferase [Patescibacteria group bacterium]|nr:UDP-N-acetylglucosamine 1-carboxyvinyltransferase [Patescibacteria group bacterium]MBU1034311.1 UDP-N-acetylglucosamine 1-carboxyvinyltransferase [Patescibacteria group bacterium]